MKLLISTIALLLAPVYLNAQTDCEKILDQKINLHEDDFETIQQELVTNFSKLIDCGLDKVDMVFFGQPPVLAALVIGWMNDDPEKVTYQRLLDEILKMKATPEYTESVKFYNDFQLLRSKKIDLENWDIDSKLLLKLMKDERLVNAIYHVIEQNPNQYDTYGAMIDDFNKMADSMIDVKEPVEELPDFFKDAELINYNEMLENAKVSGKPLLIFFTACADVNSRKMEDAFLYDNDIQKLIASDFYTVTLFVDSKKEVPKEYITTNPKTGKVMKTYGSFYIKIQEEQFKNQNQPFFVIVGNKGKVLKTHGFTLNKKEFQKFLK
ncbi:Thioredoxin-like [Paenimyroides aquimaris]|uniref:Thioredoxin-like n=1 Tax=Paenimyroides marinum TaxID=1159016 RepID=A0A1H6KVV1_9FLAO|nr:thioredoxin family protein [Paenimyroides aquimaris]SEH75813.1 Thioredoxin-like [Paenimyroides aquimaris]